MMSGIQVDALTRISKSIEDDYVELEEVTQDIFDSIGMLDSCFLGSDVKFLVSDFKEEIHELDNLNSKCEGYYLTINEVINGYIHQEKNIADSVGLYLK